MRFLACILFSISMILSGIADAQQVQPEGSATASNSLLEASSLNDPDLSTFRELVRETGVYDLFQGTGPFTAFAPNNAAFEKLKPEELAALKKDTDKLTTLLLYHVLPGKYLSKYIKDETVRTLNGKTVHLNKQGDTVTINQAKVIKADLVGSNGVVHIVDAVLVLP